MSLLLLALKHWKWAALGLLILGLGWEKHRADGLDVKLDATRVELKTARKALINPETKAKWEDDYRTCSGSLANVTTSLDRQSAATRAAKAEGDRMAAAAEKAASVARSARRDAERRAAEIASIRTDQVSCPAVDALIEEALR